MLGCTDALTSTLVDITVISSLSLSCATGLQQCLPASFSGLKHAHAVVYVAAEQRFRQVLVLYHGHLQRRAAEARPACH